MGRKSKVMGGSAALGRQQASSCHVLLNQVLTLGAAVGLSLATPAQLLAQDSGPDRPVQAALADPVLTGSKGHYRATMVVPVTQARAWAVLTNYEAMAGLMPDIKQAKVLNRHGSQLELAQTYQAPSTFGLPIRVVLAVEEKAPRWMRYRLLRGERILSLHGQWSLTRVRGGVLVDHQIALEPDLPAFLRPTYDDLNESNLRQSMAVLRRLMLAR